MKCEGIMNGYEQFCQKQMLGAFRYQLGLPTKRPKDRPTTLPLALGNKHVQVPIADYPVTIFLPVLPPPDLALSHPVRKSALFQFAPYPKRIFDPNTTEMSFGGKHYSLSATWQHGVARAPTGHTNVGRFGRMLAKIAHSFTVGEVGLGQFRPLLIPTLLKGEPCHHLVGGFLETAERSPVRHEIGLDIQTHHGRRFYAVRIRLFADLGWPTYICFTGVDLSERLALPTRMLQASRISSALYKTLHPEGDSSPDDVQLSDYTCWRCGHVVASSRKLPDDVIVRCVVCGAANVTRIDEAGERWSLSYKDAGLPEAPDMRAIWQVS